MAKIKQFQSKRKARQKRMQDQTLATLVIRVQKDQTLFDATGSVIDVVNGLLTSAVKNPGFRSAFLLAAHELAKALELQTVDDLKTAAVELSKAITAQAGEQPNPTDQTEEE